MSYADMASGRAAHAGRVRRDGPHPEAHRRRDHGLRARRRAGAGAGVATSGSPATTPSSASRRSSSASSRAPAAPSGSPGWSARRGRRRSFSAAGSSPREEALAIGLVDRSCPAERSNAGSGSRRSPSAVGGLRGREARHRRRPRRSTCAAGLEIGGRPLRGALRHQDRHIGMTSFVEHGPGKAAVHRPLTFSAGGAGGRRGGAPPTRLQLLAEQAGLAVGLGRVIGAAGPGDRTGRCTDRSPGRWPTGCRARRGLGFWVT